MKVLTFILMLCFSINAFASALVTKDDQASILTVHSTLIFTGPEATRPLVQDIVSEISKMWNEPKATVLLNGRKYRVLFEIGYQLPSPGTTYESSCSQNFIRVSHLPPNPNGDPNVEDVSNFETGRQVGHFFVENNLGHSTTAAHEFGHSLGLHHTIGKVVLLDEAKKTWANDLRDAGVPGIMFNRGTWVKPEFQYDPAAVAGAPGGSVNPMTRKVRLEDVQSTQWSHLQFNQFGMACIGSGARGF